MQSHYRLLGGPGSPYSLKMRAILRYRRIPHVWIVPQGYIGTEGELQRAGKRLLPVLQYPDGTYRADTTPLAYDLELRHKERSIMPVDSGQAFLSHLIEDFADEMLSTAMFDLRWSTAEDQLFCATRQISAWLAFAPREKLDAMVTKFVERQVQRRAQLVQGDNHELLLNAYCRTLEILERMLNTSPYLFGMRPCLGDFGLFGQLCQSAIDPSSTALMRRIAPRTFQWTQSLDDASGVEGDWCTELPLHVREMLQLVGSHYLPVLVANAAAMEQQVSSYSVDISHHTWIGDSDKYKYKCLAWLRREFAALDEPTRSWLSPLLADAGCLDALSGPIAPVADMQPL